MAIKKNDFIELTYTGSVHDGIVFDTTDASVAKNNGLEQKGNQFEPIIVCVGRKHLLPAFDMDLEGKEIDKEYSLDIKAENAFGKRVPSKLFKREWFVKQNVNPVPGLEVTVGNDHGVVRAVSGGRIYVDLNHPLAGQDIVYKYKILSIVTDVKKQIAALVKLRLGFDAKIEITDKKANVAVPMDLPAELQSFMGKEIEEATGCGVEFSKIDLKASPKKE